MMAVGPLHTYANDLAEVWHGRIAWQCPMTRFTTMRVGGPAEALVFAGDVSELGRLVAWLHDHNIDRHVIGNGSNVLVPDEGIDGVVIMLDQKLAAVETLETNKTVRVRAGAGCGLAKLLKFCTDRGFSGLEFTTGIPGSVGGAIAMNAGCWGKEISDVIHSVTMLDEQGNARTEQRSRMKFSYRSWGGSREAIIVSALFDLARGDREEIRTRCREYREKRRQKQPQRQANAGSFFKNPPDRAAGKLIEDAGLKGKRIGGAMVSTKHANFIVNTGTATAGDILALMQLIQHEVYETSGIMLEPEVKILQKTTGGI
jgi:UDP-N-acetylmuramate dehydrogenase